MKNWFKMFFLFFMLGLLVYFNSLNNKFLLDDYVFLNNPVLSGTKFILSQWDPYREQALGVLDSHESLEYFRPMTHMVYDLCYSVFKNNYWQYHLLNLFLFAFASSLIFLFIEKITGNFNLAFLAALFYLIHPINGIIVNYISASAFAFQVIFTLGTILFLLAALEQKNNRILYILSLVFSLLSLFWNESGMMGPFYLCAVILLFRNDTFRQKVFYLLPYFIIVLSFIVFRSFIKMDENIFKQVISFHMTGQEYWAALFQVIAWYISKLFIPQGIVMQWTTPIPHHHIILNVLGFCSLIFLLLFVRFAKDKILRMAIIWILIGFLPVSMAAFIRLYNGVQIEPHWFVVSSIGFFILAAYFCLALLDRSKKIGLFLLFILIFSWGAVSHANDLLWADQKTYALYWLEQVPNFKTINLYLAEACQREGELAASKKYYRLALSGYSSDLSIYTNLGVMDAESGDWKGAELNYRRALKINPLSASIYNNLGALYFDQGQWDKAQGYFARSMMIDPILLEPRLGLASIFLKNSEYQKAVNLCLKNLDIVSDDKKTLLLLVNIYIQEKDPVSLKKYVFLIIRNESDPEILMKLGVSLARNNASELAMDCFIKVLRVAPGYKDAYLAAGSVLANMGKFDRAIYIWKIGSSIAPFDRQFQNNIDKAMKLKLK